MPIFSGDNLIITDDFAIVNGDNCLVTGDGVIINGDNCQISGRDAIVNGDQCRYIYRPKAIHGEGSRRVEKVIRQPEHKKPEEQKQQGMTITMGAGGITVSTNGFTSTMSSMVGTNMVITNGFITSMTAGRRTGVPAEPPRKPVPMVKASTITQRMSTGGLRPVSVSGTITPAAPAAPTKRSSDREKPARKHVKVEDD
jgi:hypothetical protein